MKITIQCIQCLYERDITRTFSGTTGIKLVKTGDRVTGICPNCLRLTRHVRIK